MSKSNGSQQLSRHLLLTILTILFLFALMRRLFTSPLLLLPTLLPSTPNTDISTAYNSTFSFDLSLASNPSWLSRLPDTTPLTSISLPGTHDTMTISPIMTPIFQCQNHPLSTQLQAGIRYIDIRLTNIRGKFYVYHELVFTGYTFLSVLETIFDFLNDNLSETILMRLKQEGDPFGSKLSFSELLDQYILNSSLAPSFAKHLYLPPSPVNTIPTLGTLRSKILILQNFASDTSFVYGVPWISPLLQIEDFWELKSLKNMDKKFAAIEANLVAAENGTIGNGDGKLYLSHVSASVGVLPVEVAAGTRDGEVTGQNDRVGRWLEEEEEHARGQLGVVILDFPGVKIVEGVIGRNFLS